MDRHHYKPRLRKRRVLTHTDFTVYSVNGLAARNVAQPDEEFGNFATRDEFPDLIPGGEVWISEKLATREGVFFIANALARLAQEAAGLSSEQAYERGLEVERMLREHDLRVEQLLGFGDGFVEIEEVKKVGGVAVAVASDEVRRQGVDPWKRQRLIAAGADLVIAEYRQAEKLLAYLFGEI